MAKVRSLLALVLFAGVGACSAVLGLRDIAEVDGVVPPDAAESGSLEDHHVDAPLDASSDVFVSATDAADAGIDAGDAGPCALHPEAYYCDSFESGQILVPPWVKEIQGGGISVGAYKNRPGQVFNFSSAFGPTPTNGKAAILYAPFPPGPKNKRALRFYTLQPIDGFPPFETPLAGLYDLTGNGVKVSQVDNGAGGWNFQVSDTQGSTPIVLGLVKQSDTGTPEAIWQCIEIAVTVSGDLYARLDGVIKTGAVTPSVAAAITSAEIGMSLKNYGGAGSNSQGVHFDDVVIAPDIVGCD